MGLFFMDKRRRVVGGEPPNKQAKPNPEQEHEDYRDGEECQVRPCPTPLSQEKCGEDKVEDKVEDEVEDEESTFGKREDELRKFVKRKHFQFFVAVVNQCAELSPVETCKCGALLMDKENRIISYGYNGETSELKNHGDEETVVHSEQNTILWSTRDLKRASLILNYKIVGIVFMEPVIYQKTVVMCAYKDIPMFWYPRGWKLNHDPRLLTDLCNKNAKEMCWFIRFFDFTAQFEEVTKKNPPLASVLSTDPASKDEVLNSQYCATLLRTNFSSNDRFQEIKKKGMDGLTSKELTYILGLKYVPFSETVPLIHQTPENPKSCRISLRTAFTNREDEKNPTLRGVFIFRPTKS